MGLEQFVKDQLAKREARGRSPTFRAEMARENAEFSHIVKELGNNTFEAGVTVLLRTPTHVFLNSLKTLYDRKYQPSDYAKDAARLFIGKDGIVHNTFKVAANAVHLVGKGAKIGIRHLFKL